MKKMGEGEGDGDGGCGGFFYHVEEKKSGPKGKTVIWIKLLDFLFVFKGIFI